MPVSPDERQVGPPALVPGQRRRVHDAEHVAHPLVGQQRLSVLVGPGPAKIAEAFAQRGAERTDGLLGVTEASMAAGDDVGHFTRAIASAGLARTTRSLALEVQVAGGPAVPDPAGLDYWIWPGRTSRLSSARSGTRWARVTRGDPGYLQPIRVALAMAASTPSFQGFPCPGSTTRA
jgi:hypothetical protein